MTKDEALKQALEALEFIPKSGSMLGAQAEAKRLEAITAIKEVLVQPEPDWRALVLNHNADCDARCNMDRCGYKPYYEYNGRRCPDCLVYDKIEAAHGIRG